MIYEEESSLPDVEIAYQTMLVTGLLPVLFSGYKVSSIESHS